MPRSCAGLLLARTAVLGVVLLAAPASARAATVALPAGRVTFVETTYMPGIFLFKIDAGDSTCPAGTYLKWSNANLDNMKAVYATILAALHGQRTVYVVYNTSNVASSGPPGCLISYIGTY